MAELEHTLWRLADAPLRALREDQPMQLCGRAACRPSKCVAGTYSLLTALAAALSVALVVLHSTFVGQPGCLPARLAAAGVPADPADALIRLRVDTRGNASDPDYTLALTPAVAFLDVDFAHRHDIPVYDVRLPWDECFGFLVALAPEAQDVAVVNAAAHAYPEAFLTSKDGGSWQWTARDVRPHRNAFGAFFHKCVVLFNALKAFFVVTGVTALVVRVFVTSGVAMILPLLLALRAHGCLTVPTAFLRFAYPWIGAPLVELERTGRPAGPLLLAHFSYMIVVTAMYQASHLVWGDWLYPPSMTLASQMAIYGIVMVAEYFAVALLRSKAAIRFFPRFFLGVFLALNIYALSLFQGFVSLAAVLALVVLVHAMVFCVAALDHTAALRGEISAEAPRGIFTALPYPQWSAALPGTWTVFHPPTASVVSVYDVVARPGVGVGVGVGVGGGGGVGVVGGVDAGPAPTVVDMPEDLDLEMGGAAFSEDDDEDDEEHLLVRRG